MLKRLFWKGLFETSLVYELQDLKAPAVDDQNNDSSRFQNLSSFFSKPCFSSWYAGFWKIYPIDSAEFLCIMRGTDVGISKKKFPVFYGSLRSKREEKRIFFCKVRHFVNFPTFNKSLRQYLGNLITNNEVF